MRQKNPKQKTGTSEIIRLLEDSRDIYVVLSESKGENVELEEKMRQRKPRCGRVETALRFPGS